MWIIRWVVLLLIVIVVLGFSLQNQSESVVVHFLGWESGELPLYIALFVSFAFGMAAFLLIAVFQQLQTINELNKEKKSRRKLEAQLDQTRQELDQLNSQLEHSTVEKVPSIEEELDTLESAMNESEETAETSKPAKKSAAKTKKTPAKKKKSGEE